MNQRDTTIVKRVAAWAKRQDVFESADVVEAFKVTRHYANTILHRLVVRRFAVRVRPGFYQAKEQS